MAAMPHERWACMVGVVVAGQRILDRLTGLFQITLGLLGLAFGLPLLVTGGFPELLLGLVLEFHSLVLDLAPSLINHSRDTRFEAAPDPTLIVPTNRGTYTYAGTIHGFRR